MRSFLIVAASIFVMGCVTTQNASNYTHRELCDFLDGSKYLTLGMERKAIREEINRRGLNCISGEVTNKDWNKEKNE